MLQFFRNALEYDAVACSAAEGHDNVLHYLLSLGQSPNGTTKVVIITIELNFCDELCALHSYLLGYSYDYVCSTFIPQIKVLGQATYNPCSTLFNQAPGVAAIFNICNNSTIECGTTSQLCIKFTLELSLECSIS